MGFHDILKYRSYHDRLTLINILDRIVEADEFTMGDPLCTLVISYISFPTIFLDLLSQLLATFCLK